MNGGAELAPGTDFAGKYTIEATIGAGGMGIVYRALHRRIAQEVAIKMLHPSMLENANLVGRFEREARAAGQLRSRHTVRVVDVGEEPAHGPFMVMEFLHGHDLGRELEERGPLPVIEAVEWLLQACSAMGEAHDRGIVHRDLKPANLFLALEGDERVLKVLDFGISKVEDAAGSSVTNTSVTMGTPLYMSPEQVRSTKNVDLRSDVWSLGVILYELLSGKTPFEGAPAAVGAAIVSDDIPLLHTVRRDVTPMLAAIIQRALEKKRDDRYPDARAFAAALAPWSGRAPSTTAKVRPSDPKITAASNVDERAPTLAFGDLPPDAGSLRAVAPVTAPDWTNPEPPPKSRKPAVIIGAFVAVAAVAATVIAVRSSKSDPIVAKAPDAAPAPALSATTKVNEPAASVIPIAISAPAPTPRIPSPSARATTAPRPSASVVAPTPSPQNNPNRL